MQTKKAIALDIGNIGSKIEANADKLGMVAGALSYLNGLYPGNPLGGAMAIAEGLMKHPHIPDLANVTGYLFTYDPSKTFQHSIIAAIGGWLLSEVDMYPQITRIGSALQKAGIGSAEAAVVLTFLTYSGLSGSPADAQIMANIGRSYGGHSAGPRYKSPGY